MNFIVEKKSFDSAMRQLFQGRKENPADLIEIFVDDPIVTLAATGTEAQASAQIGHLLTFDQLGPENAVQVQDPVRNAGE